MPQHHTQASDAISETIELRWFFNGHAPESFIKKFSSFAASKRFGALKETRVDYYLRNRRETVGIKLRKDGDEKNIELKFLKASVRHDERNISGQVERWRKWNFPAAKFNFRNERSVLDSEWIVVEKKRHLTLIPPPGSKNENEGCRFELTSISSTQGAFWTIGFEAFSNSGQEEKNFRHAINSADLDFSGISFSCDNSYSYPKFINTLEQYVVASLQGNDYRSLTP
jgi:hypothetical protein